MKKIIAASIGLLAIICSCGRVDKQKTEAADTSIEKTVKKTDTLGVIKDVSLNSDVSVKIECMNNECVIRKINVNNVCTKIVIPTQIDGNLVTGIEYDDSNKDDSITYNIFGDKSDRGDSDENSADEELIKTSKKNVQEIVLPDSIKTIASSSFQGLVGLKKIKLPLNLTEIRDYTFARCSKLERIDVPVHVSKMDIGAFWLCKKLNRLHIQPGNNRYVEKGDVVIDSTKMSMVMFSKKKKTSIIPKNVKCFDESAFNYFAPKRIVVSKKNKYIKQKKNCIYENKSKKLVAIQSNKTNNVYIPNGIKTLDKYICCIGVVNKIVIPKSVKYWCEYWYYNIHSKDETHKPVVIEIKNSKPPVLKGSKIAALPSQKYYKIRKKYAKRYIKFFAKNGKNLFYSSSKKLYKCYPKL